MPRYPHYLRPLTAAYWPSTVLVVDCESAAWFHDTSGQRYTQEVARVHWCQLRLEAQGYVYAGCDSDSTPALLWERVAQLTRHAKPLHVLCYHATRVWSLIDLWQRLEQGQLTLTQKHAQHKAPASKVRASAVDGYLVLRDSPMIASLYHSETGAKVTLWDVRNYGVEIDATVQRGSLLVHYLCDWLTRYHLDCRRYHLGGLQLTAGSQALHGYRKGYYERGIYCHATDEVLRMEASGYHGGRVTAHRLGPARHRLHYADIRSCYTGVYASLPVPTRLCGARPDPDQHTWQRAVERGAALVQCRLKLEEPAYPYRRAIDTTSFPVKSSGGESGSAPAGDTDTCYPVGRFTTVLAGPEALDALQHGYIESVSWLAEYECEPVFAEYARALHAWRCECDQRSDDDMSKVAKLIANCFVGKWGQHKRIWVAEPDVHSDYPYGEWYGCGRLDTVCRYRSVGGLVQRDHDEGLSPDANLAIAAWITSAARVRLLNLIRAAGWDNVAYCDTDAIMVDDDGLSRLNVATGRAATVLGSVGIRWTSETVEIRGLKHYVHDGCTVCAGLPRGLVCDNMDGATYALVASPEQYLHQHERPLAYTEVRHYLEPGNYKHGVVQPDGRVLPHRLYE